jgi:hypothetical protein
MPTQSVIRVKRQGRQTVTYRNARGRTYNAVVRAVAGRPISPVLQPPTGAITGGTLAAGTFWYRVSAVNANGEGIACAEQSGVVASGTTGSVSLTITAVPGATTYKFYGRTQGAELLLVSQAGTTYVDTNAATPSGALPTLSTTPGNATVDTNYSNTTAGGYTTVPQAVAMRGAAVRYFHRHGSPAGYPAPPRA